MPEMTFPRRRFLHVAGWIAVLGVLPAIAKAGARSFSIRIGGLLIDPDTREIVADKRVRLTRAELSLLKLLWLHKGETLSREILLNHLYGGVDEPEPRIIDVFVATLRFKIFKATDGVEVIRIDTIAGRGYCCRAT
jgi:two-component system cell cycle response regulator CtrA